MPGPVNMARDHLLALRPPPGGAVLRLYGWERPTLSLGRNEPARGVWDRGRLGAAGIDVVRRPTGGRSVLHDRELTYAVILPLRALGGLRAAYRAINAALVRGLSLLGVEAEIAPEGAASRPDAGPCFDGAVGGEVVVEGRKLVGSAQARMGDRLLQHGSILLADDQERLTGLGGRAAATPPATLEALLGRVPPREEVAAVVEAGFRETLPGSWADEGSGPLPPRDAESPLTARYASEAWTWRR